MYATAARFLTPLIFLLVATTSFAVDGIQADEIAYQQVAHTLEPLPEQSWREWLAAVNELSIAPAAATPALLEALAAPERSIRTAAAHALAARAGADGANARATAAAEFLALASAPTEERGEAFRRITATAPTTRADRIGVEPGRR